MPYVVVRGNLGMANTKVYGLTADEWERMKSRLRPGPENPSKYEHTCYNSAIMVINQLEYFFGYKVVSCACQGDTTTTNLVWTMAKTEEVAARRRFVVH